MHSGICGFSFLFHFFFSKKVGKEACPPDKKINHI
jgi:hypothetical protein